MMMFIIVENNFVKPNKLKRMLKRKSFQLQPGWLKYLLQLLFAGGVMAGFLIFITPPEKLWLQWHWQQRILHLLYVLLSSIICYFLCLRVSGLRLRDFRNKA